MTDAPVGATPDRVPVPQWLLQQDMAMCPCGCIGKRKKGSYLTKTIQGGSKLLQQVMFGEDVAAAGGLLQRIDPRVKLLSLLGLLVVAGLAHSMITLAVMYAATLVLASLSALPVSFFIKRVWLFVPIFTGIVVLPATLSVVTHGDIVLTLWHWNGHPQGFTAQGLTAAARVVARVAVSISLVVLLTLTTPWIRLLAALRSLAVPRIFILIIGMAYRYIFLLLTSVTDMYQARQARTPGTPKHDRTARAFLGASVGALLGKASHLSEEVYQAMTARGYRGDAMTLDRQRLRSIDASYIIVVVAFAAIMLIGDVLLVPR
ncbi:MAG TPA: cobalt ECF transporter T component CbiQ [Pseudonocardiaceae bacterium]|jgi:cobalt/nickel transport system permease protein